MFLSIDTYFTAINLDEIALIEIDSPDDTRLIIQWRGTDKPYTIVCETSEDTEEVYRKIVSNLPNLIDLDAIKVDTGAKKQEKIEEIIEVTSKSEIQPPGVYSLDFDGESNWINESLNTLKYSEECWTKLDGGTSSFGRFRTVGERYIVDDNTDKQKPGIYSIEDDGPPLNDGVYKVLWKNDERWDNHPMNIISFRDGKWIADASGFPSNFGTHDTTGERYIVD